MEIFRKKPVLVEAEQWLGTVKQKKRLLAAGVIMEIPSQDGSCLVPTLEGNMPCKLNDYIVKDGNGQYGVYEAELFEAAFELEEKATSVKAVVVDSALEDKK